MKVFDRDKYLKDRGRQWYDEGISKNWVDQCHGKEVTGDTNLICVAGNNVYAIHPKWVTEVEGE